MKKNVIICGLIAGTILAVFMAASATMCYNNDNYEGSMVLGYSAMVLAFSLIFVAVKNFRDKINGGTVTFVQAFKIGLYITLIASSIYVAVWLVDFYIFIPDFMEKYTAHVMKVAAEEGLPQAELQQKAVEMTGYKEMYKNPLFVVLFTYAEVLPIGLIISLICAFILKRKTMPGAVI